MHIRQDWSGSYYDGRTAHREPVRIVVTAAGLQIARTDGTALLWPFHETRRAAGLHGGERLRLERGGESPETLVVADDGLLEAIREVEPGEARRLEKPPAHLASARDTVLKVAAGALLVAALYVWGLPALATFIAPRVPRMWEEELGSAVTQRMAPPETRCEDRTRQAAVEQILARILSGTSPPPPPYRFHVIMVDDSVINAFAAPGGYVIVNLGLLRATRSPEELAGVLAHEMQHVLLHHATRALAREIPIQIALSTFGGRDVFAIAARAAGTLGALRYRREDELQADHEGMRMLQAARVDPQGMVKFFRTLQAREAAEPVSYLSTHPQTAERIKTLERIAATAGYTPVPLLPNYPWKTIGRGCGKLVGRGKRSQRASRSPRSQTSTW